MDLLPVLVLIGGPPGGGKTTLAGLLAERMGLVHLSRDGVKAAIATTETAVTSDNAAIDQVKAAMGSEYGQRAFAATYSAAELLLGQGVSLVMDQAWRSGYAEQYLRPLLAMSGAVLVTVVVPREIAAERTLQRGSRPGLASVEETLEYIAADWEACVNLDVSVPRLVVDNSDSFRPSPEEIENWVWREL